MAKKIGFIGLGVMGGPMAQNILSKGFSLTVYDIQAGAMECLVQAGAVPALSPREVAQAAEIVLLSLPGRPEVEEVMLGEEGVLGGAKEGVIIVNLSTVAPSTNIKIAEAAAKKGVKVLGAPVSGGHAGALAGTLAVLVGGDSGAFEDCREVLQAFGRDISYVGEIGAADIIKLAHNMVASVASLALAEALVLGLKAGLRPDALFNALMEGVWVYPRMERRLRQISERRWQAGMRLDLQAKDSSLVLEMAKDNRFPLFFGAMANEFLKQAKCRGLGDQDFYSLITMYEDLAGVEIRGAEGRTSRIGMYIAEGCRPYQLRRIGFVGLGVMGGPMAQNILSKGFSLTVYDIQAGAMECLVQAGAVPALSPREVAQASEIVLLSLPGRPEVEEVVLGEKGVLEGAKEGTIMVNLSTVAPSTNIKIAEAAAKKGVKVLGAPVSGGDIRAKVGNLAVMVGGDREAFESCCDVLETLGGRDISYVGEIGAGDVANLACKLYTSVVRLGLVEAIAAGTKAGIKADVLVDVISTMAMGSRYFKEDLCPRIKQQNFAPGVRLDLELKDSELILDVAREAGAPLFFGALANQVYALAQCQGLGARDFASLVTLYQRLAGMRGSSFGKRARGSQTGWSKSTD